MAAGHRVDTLEELLDEMACAGRDQRKVSVGKIYEAIGERSFGPLLLAAGLVAATPLGAIPGAPTAMALAVILIAGQLLLGRKRAWLPGRFLKLSVETRRVRQSVKLMRKPARLVDRLLKPRLTYLTTGVGARAIAGLCVVIALAVPPLELVPFAVIVPGTAIVALGLALLTRDGLLAILAFALCAGGLALLATRVLG